MSAIWHQSDVPSFLAPPPSFSFYEQAEVIEVAPWQYEIAQAQLKKMEAEIERKWPGFYLWNAKHAFETWQRNKPWICYL